MKSSKHLFFGLLSLGMLIFLTACRQEKKDDIPWEDMFDGSTLNGWTAIGGIASYEVKDGIVPGTSTPNTPNTFLCTE